MPRSHDRLDDALHRSRIEHFLRTRASGAATIDAMSRLSGGTIQENWSLDVRIADGPMRGGHRWVLRCDAPATIASSMSRVEEFAVLRVAHQAGVTTPRPLWLCTDPGVIGRPFFVMERVEGTSAGHRLAKDPALVPDRRALAESLGENLARLHAVRPPCPELDFLPVPGESPALAAIATYRAHLDEIGAWRPALEWGLRWCERNAPAESRIGLVHRDYRTGNYMVHDGKLSAVLDWEFAAWGDPREDIGWFTAKCWRFGAVAREAGGIATAADFLRGYERISARRHEPEELAYWQVMAHLRWAVIASQQAWRHRSGAQRSLELALTGHLVSELELEVLALTRRERDG